jgi:hypothetical protein
MIDNRRLFEEFFDNVLKDITMIGIDLEWKPSFGNRSNCTREKQMIAMRNLHNFKVKSFFRRN